MKSKTVSEMVFESFCEANALTFERIIEGTEPTPDYILKVGGAAIYIEVKQIDEDGNFLSAVAPRTPGSHIRAKINQARDQVRAASHKGSPAVLLVYNNLDPLQMFGTERHDFLAAMYGDLTVYVAIAGQSSPGIFHGRNKSFREGKNDSFSAIGWLHRSQTGVGVHLYENAHARVPLNFDALPSPIQFNRIQVEDV